MVMTFGNCRKVLTPNHADLLQRYLRDCKLRKIQSADQYWRAVTRFVAWSEENGIDPLEFKKSNFKEYLLYLQEVRGLIHKSLEIEFSRLSDFYGYLVDEGIIDFNPIPEFRKRNIRAYKASSESQQRRVVSVMDAAKMVGSALETRDRAIILLLLKTGIRCHELCELDVSDIDTDKLTVTVKPTPKRSNGELYFDHETADTLRLWLVVRSSRRGADEPALFTTNQGGRIKHDQVERTVKRHAERIGLHNPNSKKLKDRFTPHCCRHWFTTHLIRAGMSRDFVKELRGDARHEAIDIYNHIDKKELRESYLAHIPQLGV